MAARVQRQPAAARRRRARWRGRTGRLERAPGPGRPVPASRSGSWSSPPSTRRVVDRGAEVGADQGDQLGDLGGDALQDRENQVSGPGGERQPGERARGVRAPPGRGEPGQRRDAEHAVSVGGGETVQVLRRRRSAPARSSSAPPRRRCRPGRRGSRSSPSAVRQATEVVSPWADRTAVSPVLASRKAPVPKVHLAVPGRGIPRPAAPPAGRRPARRPDRRRRTPWSCRRSRRSATMRGTVSSDQPEQLEQLRIPRHPVEVRQQRPAGRRGVGDELAAEVMDEPAVGRGDDALGRDVAAQPGHLGRGEVGVEDQPGALGHPARRLAAARATSGSARRSCQTIADDSGAPVARVPGQHRLALVGQGHARHRPPGDGQRAATGVEHRGQQFVRGPARPRRRAGTSGARSPRRPRARRRRGRRRSPWCRRCPGRWPGRPVRSRGDSCGTLQVGLHPCSERAAGATDVRGRDP